jgi:hypothetical protein
METWLLFSNQQLQKTATQIAERKERTTMLENQFQFAILATEDRIRDLRARKAAHDGQAKRVFRLGERQAPRQVGRR